MRCLVFACLLIACGKGADPAPAPQMVPPAPSAAERTDASLGDAGAPENASPAPDAAVAPAGPAGVQHVEPHNKPLTKAAKARFAESLLIDISRDGTQALFLASGVNNREWYAVDIATGKVVAWVTAALVERAETFMEDPDHPEKEVSRLNAKQLAAELASVAAIVAPFPRNDANFIASSDGRYLAMDIVGNLLYVADTVSHTLRGPIDTASVPLRFSPDGSLLFYRRSGMNEEMYVVSSAGGKPRRVTGVGEGLLVYQNAATPTALRLVQESAEHEHACILEVTYEHPEKAVALGCLPSSASYASCEWSWSGERVGCSYTQGLGEDAPRRYAVFDVTQRTFVHRSTLPEGVSPFALGEHGVVARWTRPAGGPAPLELVDLATGKSRRIRSIPHYDMPGDLTSAIAGPDLLVFGAGGEVKVVELSVP